MPTLHSWNALCGLWVFRDMFLGQPMETFRFGELSPQIQLFTYIGIWVPGHVSLFVSADGPSISPKLIATQDVSG